ncbi:MAG: FHA domain-containing protein [Lentisphaeria bacterium]|nr:FHA domain-containing protein [Lentisphaeria bacterium]
MRLLFLDGPRSGEHISLASPEIRIGRETDNDIQLLVGGVSRYHALIRRDGSSWSIRDLGSTNGTKVNGSVIGSSVVLHGGDLILIGDQMIRVEEDASGSGDPAGKEQENAPVPLIRIVDEPPGKKDAGKAPFSSAEGKKEESGASVPLVRFHSAPSGESKGGKKDSSSPEKSGGEKEKSDAGLDNSDTAILESMFGDSSSGSASSSSSFPSGKSASPEVRKKKTLGNVLFYVVLVAVAAVCVCLFLALNQGKPGSTVSPVVKKDPNQFFLAYEKETLTRSSIFRFEMLLECRWVENAEKKTREEAAFVHYAVAEQKAEDNIAYKYVLPPQRIDLEDAVRLRKKIQETDFMKLVSDSGDIVAATDGNDQSSRITVGFSGHLNSVAVRNTSPKLSYRQVEELIEQFTEDTLGVRTVSMSVEEMQEEAKKHYAQARQYFENYEAKPENLRLAIKRFRLTSQMLERFQPRPKMWSEANESLQKAEQILAGKRKELYNDLKIKLKLKEYPEALEKAKILMDYLEPGSANYYRIRDVKISIERELARNKRRK